MKGNSSKTEKVISTFICSSCSELLFEPIPLPCGSVVCNRCFRLAISASNKGAKGAGKCASFSQKCTRSSLSDSIISSSSSCTSISKSSHIDSSLRSKIPVSLQSSNRLSLHSSNSLSLDHSSNPLAPSIASESSLLMASDSNESWMSVSAYTCPSKECKLIHKSRKESIHTFANHVLRKVFPVMQDAVALVRDGEKLLLDWRNQDGGGGDRESSDRPLSEYDTQILSDILQNYLNPSIEKSPFLQLAYVIRCKVLAQMGLFKEASTDASKAQEINPGNKRGLCCEKMVSWLQQMRESCPLRSKKVCSNIKEVRLQLRGACHGLFAQLIYCPSWNAVSEALNVTIDNLSIEDLGCHLCLEPLGDPITTPCGHSFCRNCLISSLTHSKQCPLCRELLPSIGFFAKKPADKFITSLLTHVFDRPVSTCSFCPAFAPQWIPIYHGPLIYPNTSTSFHISETHYRVLIKRVIETTGTFGVILPPCTQSCLVVNHGTIVKITNFEPLLSCDIVSTIDGNLPRYVVQVTGLHRFKIEETRLTDGNYFEAQSIRVEDIEVDDGPWDIKALEKLVLLSRSYVEKLFASLPPTARQHFESKHGPIPLDPTDLSYWLAEFLPLNPYTLYQILPLNRVTKRLQLLCNWMQAASNNHEVK